MCYNRNQEIISISKTETMLSYKDKHNQTTKIVMCYVHKVLSSEFHHSTVNDNLTLGCPVSTMIKQTNEKRNPK